jgi:hypothetical protein
VIWRFLIAASAAAAALAPVPPEAVERFYAAGLYPHLQRWLTSASNLTAIAIFDVMWAGAAAAWVWLVVRAIRARGQSGWVRAAARIISGTLVLASCVYLAFLVTWGLNYRRVPLGDKLALDRESLTQNAARTLAGVAVGHVNGLHGDAHRSPLSEWEVDPSLARAFAAAQVELGFGTQAQPARPKRTLLDAYFRAVGVDGMTAPFFAETLVPSDLLPSERPVIIAHEWSHLAGLADEGEAGFLAWLTCLSGPAAAQYSGWLSIYSDAIRVLPREDRQAIAARLAPGPIADLRALAERRRRNVQPRMAQAGWGAYDRYLRANRVESGMASYGEALELLLGTEVGRRVWGVGQVGRVRAARAGWAGAGGRTGEGSASPRGSQRSKLTNQHITNTRSPGQQITESSITRSPDQIGVAGVKGSSRRSPA